MIKMIVCIDDSGQDNHVTSIDPGPGAECGGPATDPDDQPFVDGHEAVLDNRAIRVHGDQAATLDDQVDRT
ncbi:MAG: hypothetical protein WB867_09070 [Candidatus Dormiibacterota bacterium]